MVKRMMKPITVSDETIDLETIMEVGIGGKYLTHPRTYGLFRNEHFMTTMFNRLSYNEWKEAGEKSLFKHTSEIVKKRIGAISALSQQEVWTLNSEIAILSPL